MAILEEIKLITKQRIEQIENSINEIQNNCILDNTFVFKKGKIYGIVGEHGEGGELISSLLSGRISAKNEIAYYDGVKVDLSKIQDKGWYVGKSEYTKGFIKREISVRKALKNAIKKYGRYKCIDEVINEFGLTADRLDYRISKYSGEKWRASLAIGYACKKEIFCFSWMDTAYFYNIMISSGVFRFFKKMKEEGLIIILPTSRKENVMGLVDEIVEINNPQYKYVVSENTYFKEYF